MQKILFVCTGNICRSPTAEGVFRHHLQDSGLADSITVDSAGTHGYHIGAAPDTRSVAVARKRGIVLDGLRARKLALSDFHDFDLLLGLDFEHVEIMRKMAPKGSPARIDLFLEYAGGTNEKEVPDPYYGNNRDFEHVLTLIETGSRALIEKIKTNLKGH